ncbi:MAG: thiolase family protein, partial [Chloroflexi bacterium]|nr:thiolase family protein [Chloroflexota bacterium]
INTHGGQLSYGQQPQHAGGLSQVLEAVLQLQGRAGGRQARRATTCFVNG